MTYKYREFNFKEHTRVSQYLKPGDFIQINDPDGFVAFMKIRFAEVMGLFPILVADEFDPIVAKGVRLAGGPVLPATPSGPFVAMEFLTPSREDRLIQARPVIVALYRPNIAIATAGQLVPPQPAFGDVYVQWVHPFQTNRGGTDQSAPITMSINSGAGGIPQQPGGRLGGVINALDIYARDDPDEEYDVFVLAGTEPGYRVLNNHPTFDMGGGGTPNADLDFDWYLVFQGYRYVMEPVSEKELKKLRNYEEKFRAISVGGVPQASTIRAGGV